MYHFYHRILDILDRAGNAIPFSDVLASNQSSFRLFVHNVTNEQFRFSASGFGQGFSVNADIFTAFPTNHTDSSRYAITIFPDDRLFESDSDSQLASAVIGITNQLSSSNQSATIDFSVNQASIFRLLPL